MSLRLKRSQGRGLMISLGVAIGISTIAVVAVVLILQAVFKLNIKPFVILAFVLFLTSSVSLILSSFLVTVPLLGAAGALFLYVAFALVVLHCSSLLGVKKTIVFFAIAWSFGLVSETLGAARGLIFGPYSYNLPKFFFGLVPFETPISWAVIIYVAYALTNQFMFGAIGDRPSLKLTRLNAAGLIIVASAIGGLIAMNLDMILDPVAVSPQNPGWVWIGGGPYFEVPISNFIGWFFVTFFAVLLFRFYETLKSEPLEGARSIDVYIPVIYLAYFLVQASRAIEIGHPEFVLIGFSSMFPFILFAALILYVHKVRSKRG
jgi:uncharacterized membrane protein